MEATISFFFFLKKSEWVLRKSGDSEAFPFHDIKLQFVLNSRL